MKLDLDIEQFWKDEALAHKENCFSKQSPQVALGIRMSEECVFAELGEEGQPWGYTPLESAAFHIPTITTTLAGFGLWVNSVLGRRGTLSDGVEVVERNDSNYFETADVITKIIRTFAKLSEKEVAECRKKVEKLAEKALWKHFIKNYMKAYDFALQAVNNRILN